jgi:mannose-6-phosphate isomerase
MWYIADADPGAELFVGLKRGVNRTMFEEAIGAGRVAECFHRIDVKSGDAMFLPSGRVHAIGAGLVIFEIQQNSDTTFRVHDWNRVGLDGKPRELHVAQSLESIDFNDVEPPGIRATIARQESFAVRALIDHTLFRVTLFDADAGGEWRPPSSRVHILACLTGPVTVRGGGVSQTLQAGDFALTPASLADAIIDARAGARFLLVDSGQ